MSSNDDVRPISAPNDGPDPRIEAPIAEGDSFVTRPPNSHQMPEPDGNLDISNPGPTVPDPGFAPRPPEGHRLPEPDGDRDISNPGPIAPDPGFARPSEGHQMPAPDGNFDLQNPGRPTVPDPGFSGGLAPMSAADASGAPPVHGLERPDRPTDIRNVDPSPGTMDPGFAAGGLAPMTAADAGGPQGHALERPDHPVDVRDLDPAPGYRDGMAPGGSSSGGVQTMAGGGGMQSNGISGVDNPAALSRAGQASTELAGHVRSSGMVGEDGQILGAVGALSGDLWGGELGAELMKTMESWDRQATKLRKSCESIGAQCTQTANNYTTTESANESEMNSVSNSLADFN